MDTTSLRDIDNQIENCKAAIRTALTQLDTLHLARVEAFIAEPFTITPGRAHKCGVIEVYAGEEPGTIDVDTDNSFDAVIETLRPDELSAAWKSHTEAVRGAIENTTGIYCDGHPEEPASRYWVFLLNDGCFLLLHAAIDFGGTRYFEALITRHISNIITAYRITVEDGLY